MFSFSQQAAQDMDNGQALVKDDEGCKSRYFFPGQGQQMLQVGDKMDGVVKEIDRKVSELGSGRSCSRPACMPGGHISKFNKEICSLASMNLTILMPQHTRLDQMQCHCYPSLPLYSKYSYFKCY